MTVADMKAAIALAVEQAMNLVQTADAPAVKPAKPKGKRTLSEEQKRKMAEGRKRAAAAKVETPKPAAKPAKPGESVTVIGGIEVVDYTREDGTPGVVIRPKGRRRGIAFGKGDFALYAAFVNTLRSGECEKITRAVVARTGR